MSTIDHHWVIETLRTVGAHLKETFLTLEPIAENDAMMKAFRAIDGKASHTIRESLNGAYPQIAWLDGELEGGEAWQGAREGRFWVCDAVDGAVQFLRGIPQWCISLTLIEAGEPTFAVVYDVMHGELFHACRGKGAFLNGKPIEVNRRQSHAGGLLAFSQPPFDFDPEVIRKAADSLKAVLPVAGAVRNLGPTSLQLAYVASGRLDAFWEFGEDTFNCLGGALLVTEAGGEVTDVSGAPYRMQASSLIAAPPSVRASLALSFAQI
jgi:myo-inositol-1(or 4)-monophosphatase